MALLSDGGIIRRFVLVEGFLEPGHLPLNSRQIAGQKLFVEIRNGSTHQLPIEHIRQLSLITSNLIVDPHTIDHRIIMDCLLLGADEGCIDSNATLKEIQLLHATTEKSILKIEIAEWPLGDKETDSHHQNLLRLAALTGRKAIVITSTNGVLARWWDDLPENIANDFDWHFAPSEGKVLKLKHDFLITGWLV